MKRSDVLIGGVAVALSAAVYIDTLSFPKMADGTPGPALFPQILSALFALFGIILIVQARHPHVGDAVEYRTAAVVKAGLMLAAIAFYVALVQRLGFLITATILTAVLMILLDVRVKIAVPAAVVTAVAFILLFEKVLRVPLPLGILGV